MTAITKHHGSCVCGDVRFEVELDPTRGSRCNCTMCTKLGTIGTIVAPAAFRLTSDEAKLASFTRTPEIGTRYFCARCHIFCFSKGHLEMLGGDFVSVNVSCVDGFDLARATLVYWDGRNDNWESGPRSTPWPISPG